MDRELAKLAAEVAEKQDVEIVKVMLSQLEKFNEGKLSDEELAQTFHPDAEYHSAMLRLQIKWKISFRYDLIEEIKTNYCKRH